MSTCVIDNVTYTYKDPQAISFANYCVKKVVFEGQDVFEDSYSVAWLKNFGEARLAIRWNVKKTERDKKLKNSKGYPKERWFVLPREITILNKVIHLPLKGLRNEEMSNNAISMQNTYISPDKVTSLPTTEYKLIKVVSEGTDVLGDSYSVAWLKNYGESRLAIRWNISKGEKNTPCIGYPYGGTKTKEPYWFVLPRGTTVLNGILVLPLEDHCK